MKKTEEKLETHFDRWMYSLKNLHKLDNMPLRLQNKLFIKLFQLAKYNAMDKQSQNEYLDSFTKYNELKNTIDTYQKEITLERERALKEKERADMGEKRVEEKKLELEQKRIKTIKVFYFLGLDIQEIADKTVFNLDFVNKTVNNMKI